MKSGCSLGGCGSDRHHDEQRTRNQDEQQGTHEHDGRRGTHPESRGEPPVHGCTDDVEDTRPEQPHEKGEEPQEDDKAEAEDDPARATVPDDHEPRPAPRARRPLPSPTIVIGVLVVNRWNI